MSKAGTTPSTELDTIIEELALNYEHKDHKKDCMAAETYREYRTKLTEVIAQERNKAERDVFAFWLQAIAKGWVVPEEKSYSQIKAAYLKKETIQ